MPDLSILQKRLSAVRMSGAAALHFDELFVAVIPRVLGLLRFLGALGFLGLLRVLATIPVIMWLVVTLAASAIDMAEFFNAKIAHGKFLHSITEVA